MPGGAVGTRTTTGGAPVPVYRCPSGALTFRDIKLPLYPRAALTMPPPAKLYVYDCDSPLWIGAPMKSCSVPGVVPRLEAFEAAISGPNGSFGSGWIGPAAPTFP